MGPQQELNELRSKSRVLPVGERRRVNDQRFRFAIMTVPSGAAVEKLTLLQAASQ